MSGRSLPEAIASIERRNPVWKVGGHPANSGRQAVTALIQEKDGVIEIAIETSRQSSVENSQIRISKYVGAQLNASGQLGEVYGAIEDIFVARHMVQWEFRQGLFTSGGKFHRPRHVPADHDFLLKYVDQITAPEYRRRATEEAEQLQARQSDANKHRDAFFTN